jgi:two-component system chemotaxis response regulator CheB
MIRVLVVDDSPTMRSLIRAILESDPALQVVGEGYNGLDAVRLCHELQPDIITMDIRMPDMNGYEAIHRIMSESPRPIVVLTSTVSDLELQISFKALEAGALMVIGKPHGLPDRDPEAAQLIDQVRAMAGVKVVGRRRAVLPAAQRRTHRPGRPDPTSPRQARIIAIGASTGGPPALNLILGQLATNIGVPVVIVQHISPGFVDGLARWLDETTPLRVKVGEHREPLRPAMAYLAPDDRHLVIRGHDVITLEDTPPVDGHRPSATALLKSVARTYGQAAVGVLLTGMGRDGATGLRAMCEAGARTIAQDKASCVVFGMPHQAIALDAAREVLALDKIGRRLLEVVPIQPEIQDRTEGGA